jgi:hypothetical protein
MPDPSAFPGYETYSQYRPYGNNYDNPIINSLAFGAFGLNYAPRPGEGQSYYDASIERTRTRQFMGLQGSEFAGNMAFKAAGLNPDNPAMQMFGRNFASPDSGVARLLSPMIGGNPMAAAQGLYAGLQGANIMGAFGRPEGVNSNETSQMMRTLEKSFYQKEGMGSVANKMDSAFTNRLLSDPALATQSGIGALSEDAANDAKSTGRDRRIRMEGLAKDATSLLDNEARRGTKDFNKKLSKELNDHIEQVLTKANNLTAEELKNARDSNGVVKPEVIRNLTRTELQRAGIEEAGLDYNAIKNTKLSDIADKISEGREAKDVRLNIISQARQEYDKATTDDERAAANKKIKEQLAASGVKVPEGILGFGASKKIDTKFLNEQEAKLKASNYAEYQASQYQQYKAAGGRYSGINFANTRGFNVEDFTSAFKSSAELGMLGTKGGVGKKFDEFMQNSGGALSAARSVFGNKSAGELVGKISDLLGTSAVDMSSKKGSAEVEKYLRDMKATARVAGVSMNAMLATIDAAKDLAKNNPRLQNLNSGAVADMSIKAFQTVSAMSGVMSAGDMRRAGDTQGMVASKISEQQKLLSSDMGQNLVALQQMFAGDAKKSAAVQEALKQFPQGVKPNQMPQLLDAVMKQPGMEGMSRAELMIGMNNTFFKEEGQKNKNFTGTATSMMEKGVQSSLYSHIFNSTKVKLDRAGFDAAYQKAKQEHPELNKEDFKAQYVQKQIADGYKEAVKKDPDLTMKDYVGTFMNKDGYSANLYGQYSTTINEGIARQLNPEYFKKLDKKRADEAKIDAKLDKKYGARYAPAITQLMSTLASGDSFSDAQASKLLGVFGEGAGAEKLKGGFQQAITSAGTEDYKGTAAGLAAATGENVTAEDLKNMAVAGFSTKDKTAADALKRLDTLTDKEKKGTITDTEKKQLKALQDEKRLGILSSDKAFKTGKDAIGQGHDAAAITAAAIEGQKDKITLEEFNKGEGKELLGGLDKLLAGVAKDTKDSAVGKGINAIQDYYKGDTEKMIKDAKEGTGIFDAKGDAAKKYGVDLSSEKFDQVRKDISETGDKYDEEKKKITGDTGNGASAADTTADMNKSLSALTAELQGGTLAKAVELLATKV